jgi:hypothetical protein
MIAAPDAFGEADIGLGDGAGARMDDAGLDLVGAELLDGTGNGFDRALHVALDQKRKLLAAGVLQLRHHLLERTARTALARSRLVAGKPLAVFGDLTGTAFILDHRKAVAGLRRALKAENFDRESGSGFLDVLATVIDQRADTAPLVAGNEDFARLERAGLNQNGGNRTAATIELGLDHDAFGGAIGVGLQIEKFGLQQDRVEQLVEVELLGGGDLDVEDFTAHAFDEDFVLQKVGADLLRIGVGLSILLIATMIGTPAALA